eukprot:CAMPEP_0196651668 /NCGR_PEP_ID=MMETSP1086-20130531/688_1 /TAXON_ID=77921 /ORGANISM="Cyanoptyche  gloeocystis , Strain SAG4.97" /LENGTH=324 /DNA_ID=CAMNT_0041981785 /DNA_START=92 /DNA_END=1066 /DNA_ORIENTATION=-
MGRKESPKMQKKAVYLERLGSLLEEYSKIFCVLADNVGSNQMQKTRLSLRGDAIVLMGKNTMIRKVMKAHAAEKNPDLEKFLPYVKGNVGFIFTNRDLKDIRDRILANKVGAPAKAGSIAPCDVFVPAGGTGMDPSQTSFFQALNIATKINKGQVEIVNPVHLVKKGEKVGSSEATLLTKLNINPFSYGLVVLSVYDNGSVFTPEGLDITEDDLLKKFQSGLATITAFSLGASFPTAVAVPHVIMNGYKNVLSVALATGYSFPRADKLKELLSDPAKMAALAAAAAASSAAPAAAAAAPAKEEKKEEKKEEPEEEEDFGLDLFG